MAGVMYSAKSIIIINYTILVANTWELAASEVNGVRRWMIKASENTYNPFDLAFTSAPTTYMSTSGIGFSLDNVDLQPVYVRCATVGTIIEILYCS